MPEAANQEKWELVVQPNYLLAHIENIIAASKDKEASMPRTVALKESAPPRSQYERHPPE